MFDFLEKISIFYFFLQSLYGAQLDFIEKPFIFLVKQVFF